MIRAVNDLRNAPISSMNAVIIVMVGTTVRRARSDSIHAALERNVHNEMSRPGRRANYNFHVYTKASALAYHCPKTCSINVLSTLVYMSENLKILLDRIEW